MFVPLWILIWVAALVFGGVVLRFVWSIGQKLVGPLEDSAFRAKMAEANRRDAEFFEQSKRQRLEFEAAQLAKNSTPMS
jgi:hypothetical protein